ncbi:hypothetical protein DMA11_07655 [Marinilabiliaceae bacterium JC017]|nr:hypothetical protein DMA11_07655 [Marinilabiliaceae bacterium JC017]
MARLNNKLLADSSGKLDLLVVYQMFGNTYVRTRPGKYRDRKSPAQLAQRQKMQLVTTFLRPFKELLRITFASEAQGRTAYHAAKSYNLKHGLCGEYPHQAIDSDKALLSYGPLNLPQEIKVTRQSGGLLFEWEKNLGDSAASDTLLVMAFNPLTLQMDYRFTGIHRNTGNCLWNTPLSQSGDELEVWLAFRNREETLMSDSRHVKV